jgi:PhnB protein
MVKTENNSIPTSIAPWFSVQNGAKAVEFYKSAFGAAEKYRLETPGGLVVNLSIDGAEFWVSDGSSNDGKSATLLGGETIRMILVVTDPQLGFSKALKAGAGKSFR